MSRESSVPSVPYASSAPIAPGGGAARVLGLLRLAGEAGTSQGELAAATGLTPQAVSKISARLRAEGFVAEAGRRASTGGKPSMALRLVPGARHAVGLQLDRDRLTAVLTDLAGTPLAQHTGPLDLGERAEKVLEAAVAAVRAVTADTAAPEVRPLLGVGVATPGPLDHAAGVLGRVTGFPEWDGYPLRDALAERLGDVPVTLDKDTNAAVVGLAVREGRPGESFAYLHLGTGLGAGLFLAGRLYRGGLRNGAGEFGHQVVQFDGAACDCGKRGCVEALCMAAVRRGDTAGAAHVLGVGAANLASLLDIDRVLLGGRKVLAEPGPYVEGVAGALSAADTRSGEGAAAPRVAVAPGGPRTVADGAAELVLAPLFGYSA